MLQKGKKTEQESYHQEKLSDGLLRAMEIQTLHWDFTALGPVWGRKDILGLQGMNVTHGQAVVWRGGEEGMAVGIFKGGTINSSSYLHL